MRVNEFWSVTCDDVASSARPSTDSETRFVRAKKTEDTSSRVRRSWGKKGRQGAVGEGGQITKMPLMEPWLERTSSSPTRLSVTPDAASATNEASLMSGGHAARAGESVREEEKVAPLLFFSAAASGLAAC